MLLLVVFEYVRVMQFLLALMLIIMGFMHIDNALGTRDWCSETTEEVSGADATKFSCIGDSLVWGEDDKQYTVPTWKITTFSVYDL